MPQVICGDSINPIQQTHDNPPCYRAQHAAGNTILISDNYAMVWVNYKKVKSKPYNYGETLPAARLCEDCEKRSDEARRSNPFFVAAIRIALLRSQ